jgi:tetratricopeptide (TPR) repeat protein
MNVLSKLSLLFLLSGAFSGSVCAQDDEARQASGLPMLIGENSSNKSRGALSGKLTIQGLDPTKPKPTVYVAVYYLGALIDKRVVNDSGYYYVPSVPRENAILAVEVDGIEMGRYSVPSSAMGSIKQDLVINWLQGQNPKERIGVLSIKNYYQRSSDNQKIFEKALVSVKEKKPDNSIKLFKQLLENDPQDFVAWTELGTLYFSGEKYAEAEAAYTKALELKPDFIVSLLNLGKLYLAQKQAEKAFPALIKAVETEPGSADAQHYLGEAYLQARKGSKAVIYLNEAIRLAPAEKADIHLRLAVLYNAANLKDKAVDEYKLFLEKIPKHAEREKIEKYIKENSSK